MVTDHLDGGEGELLARVRPVVGPGAPIVTSLDLHANVTEHMLACANLMVANRTSPHIDMAETGPRAERVVHARISGGGFSEVRPGALAYGSTAASAQEAVTELERLVASHEGDFDAPVYTADAAVRHTMVVAARSTRPVVIADTQDNPGAGGDSDTTGMLRALLTNGAGRSGRSLALGLMADAEAAQATHRAGPGATITLALGGKSGVMGDTPLHGSFRVERLSDGNVVCEGPFMRGSTARLGASACLSIEGLRIVVVSNKSSLADQQMLRFIGIEPTEQGILVNKRSVHFRADFTPIAQEILVPWRPGR